MGRTARIRDRSVLDGQITALRLQVDAMPAADGPAHTTSDFQLGALDALIWITGGGPAPLTGALAAAPISLELIVAELAAAQDVLYGRPSRRRDYARGVEHGLMWAQHATETPPLPPPRRAGTTRRPAMQRPRHRDSDDPRALRRAAVGSDHGQPRST